MSRQIERHKLENPELLDPYDIWYLHTRNMLPAGVTPPTHSPWDAANFKDEDDEPVEVEIHEILPAPTISDQGGIIQVEEEDYLDGWNNDRRRAELVKRGLIVMGTKDELIARLRRSDSNQLLESDYDKLNRLGMDDEKEEEVEEEIVEEESEDDDVIEEEDDEDEEDVLEDEDDDS